MTLYSPQNARACMLFSASRNNKFDNISHKRRVLWISDNIFTTMNQKNWYNFLSTRIFNRGIPPEKPCPLTEVISRAAEIAAAN